jgi:hypothetical protein
MEEVPHVVTINDKLPLDILLMVACEMEMNGTLVAAIQVCRGWRDLFTSEHCGSLWTKVDLTRQAKVNQLYLKRSKTVPIDLTIGNKIPALPSDSIARLIPCASRVIPSISSVLPNSFTGKSRS